MESSRSEEKVLEGERAGVAMAMEAWTAALSDAHPEKILSLYADDAVLWGTLSRTRRDDPGAIRDYFEQIFTFADRKVVIQSPFIRVYGNTAVNTGYYTFSWVKDGRPETIPARYSFTYVKRKGKWLIIDHHSSVIPAFGCVT